MKSSEAPSIAYSDTGPRRRGLIAPCACCGRTVPLTFHHLIPRKLHRRAHFKKHYTKPELQAGIMVCRLCHKGIHRLYDEMTLGKQFSTHKALINDDALAEHFRWVAKQREATG